MSRSLTPHLADRLGSTLFLAALAHGVIILGITFSNPPFLEHKAATQALNVTLVVDTHRIQPNSDDSTLLAQIDSEGHGSLPKGDRPTSVPMHESPAGRKSETTGKLRRDGDAGTANSRHAILVTPGTSARQQATARPDTQSAATRQSSHTTRAVMAPPSLAAELDNQAANPKKYDKELVASPSTRKSILAKYLQHWRHRIERIGTLHFPAVVATDKPPRNPIVEVAINAEGQLDDIVIKRSSGNGVVDQAALNILRLAAPFDPLPAAIRSKYNVLRFAYEWQFSEGPENTNSGS